MTRAGREGVALPSAVVGRFFLCLLPAVAKSFEGLRTTNGVVNLTFREVCQVLASGGRYYPLESFTSG